MTPSPRTPTDSLASDLPQPSRSPRRAAEKAPTPTHALPNPTGLRTSGKTHSQTTGLSERGGSPTHLPARSNPTGLSESCVSDAERRERPQASCLSAASLDACSDRSGASAGVAPSLDLLVLAPALSEVEGGQAKRTYNTAKTALTLLLAVLTTPAAHTQPTTDHTPVCPTLTGWQALACIRDAYSPTTVLGYDTARDSLFSHVWRQTEVTTDTSIIWHNGIPDTTFHHTDTLRFVEALYGGARGLYDPDSTSLSPRLQAQSAGFNTEHVWPQSRGADQGDAHSDLHHLAPAWAEFNSARSNRPFGSGFDQWPNTYKWHKGRTTRYASASAAPPKEPWLYSRVERDFLSTPDNGDGWTSLAEMGRFDVRDAVKGDVARMAAYVLALYQIEAEDGQQGRAFIERTLDVLLDWHLSDPASAEEQTRNDRIHAIQGNRNPFVLDPTLMRRAFYQGVRERPPTAAVWINEIHYANGGADVGEGVEIAGPAGTNLYGYRLWFYSRSGRTYGVDLGGGARSHRLSLTSSLSGTPHSGHLGALWIPAAKMRGGCNGLALIAPNGAVEQFLSYGGCRFNALSGPVYDFAALSGATSPTHPDSLVWSDAVTAPGRWSAQEWDALAPGQSLQLTGSGGSYADFTWTTPTTASPGSVNSHQSHVTSLPSARSGGSGNAAAPALALTAEPNADARTLHVGALYPNPTRDRIRFHATTPVTVTLYDALGRRIPTLSSREPALSASKGAQRQPAPHSMRRGDLPTSHLAPGLYIARFTSGGPTPHTVTRCFTVAR